MNKYVDNAPIGHTCPKIDKVIDIVKNLSNKSLISKNNTQEILSIMEDIRDANYTLRNWGNELYNDKDELIEELNKCKNTISRLSESLQFYKNYSSELETKTLK